MDITEKYRPKSFADLVGQEKAVKRLEHIGRDGYGGKSIWIAGPSGCGKTTSARIIAERHCQGVGSIVEYVSADKFQQSDMDDLLEKTRSRSFIPLAYIINEAHGLSARIVRQLLGVLEGLPSWICVIFTTTIDGEESLFEGTTEKELTPWFRRVSKVQLTRRLETGSLTEVYAQEVMRIARIEGLDGGKDLAEFKKLVTKADNSIGYALKLVDDGILL